MTEREANGDPRPSLAERYGDHAAYLQQFKESVQELLEARFLLPEDASRLVDEAARRGLFEA
jgi:hypothetical protein